MKKGIVILLAVSAVGAWAGDLNPVGNNVCGAGSMDDKPYEIIGEAEFDVIYGNLSVKIGNGEMWMINTDDTTWWDSGELPDRIYAYLMVKFNKPYWYDEGTLNWCVRGAYEGDVDGPDVRAYRWYCATTPHFWDLIDENGGGSVPPTRNYNIPASYFGEGGGLWLLFVVPGRTRVIGADVVDIHY
jgi:hypothetical protein